MKKYVGVTELPSELRNAADVYVSYPIVVQLMERAARVIEGMTFAATLALEAVEEIEYDNEMYCVWCGKTAHYIAEIVHGRRQKNLCGLHWS
jgi:hypothetical protein